MGLFCFRTHPFYAFGVSLVLLFLGLMAWITPGAHDALIYFDVSVFHHLNKTLLLGAPWQQFWGALNHKAENKVSLFLAIFIHLITIWRLPKEKRLPIGCNLLFLWAFFEALYMCKDYFFEGWLAIKRASPSIFYGEKSLRLSELLCNPRIKDSSGSCFPSGHALFCVYWGLMSLYFVQKPYNKWAMAGALFMTLPRLISGAHWITDVLFSALLAYVCLTTAQALWHLIFLRPRIP